jgi:hypothetical protein
VQESREQEGCLEPVKLVEASPEGFCLLKTVIAVAFMEPLQVSASYPNMLLQQFSLTESPVLCILILCIIPFPKSAHLQKQFRQDSMSPLRRELFPYLFFSASCCFAGNARESDQNSCNRPIKSKTRGNFHFSPKNRGMKIWASKYTFSTQR